MSAVVYRPCDVHQADGRLHAKNTYLGRLRRPVEEDTELRVHADGS
jgi:hypothetical protein